VTPAETRWAYRPGVEDLFAGLPEDVRAALAGPPADEKALLELQPFWPGLDGAEARVAARLRLFLLTWDPLGWLEDRPLGSATATGDGDQYEVVLYLPLQVVLRHARMLEATVAESLALWAESVVAVGAAHEALLVAGGYPGLAAKGTVPELLSEPRAERAFRSPTIRLAAPGWEPIGLGAIQDLVQDAFGPVDLDRTAVRLQPASRSDPRCPACAGRRFGFPAELEEAREEMCRTHSSQAERVREERLARAAESNPEGWTAIVEASARLSRPSAGVPPHLEQQLDAALERDPERRLSPEDLRADAGLALALAAHFAARPEAFADFRLETDWYLDWLIELPLALAAAGLVDEAVQVGDTYAELGEEARSFFANGVAVALAKAGRREEALARAEDNLRRFPGDVWTLLCAGDVRAALGNAEAAEAAYAEAIELADATQEGEELAEAYERLSELLAGQPGRQEEAQEAALEAEAWRSALDGEPDQEEPRHVVKIGRNEPCPCGSERKYKRCCGA